MGPSIRRGVLTSGRAPRRSRRAPLIGAAVVLVLVGTLLGRLLTPAPEPPGASLAPAAPVTAGSAPSPPRLEPQDGERNRPGAARAAARALSSLADARLLSSPAKRRAAMSAIATPGYRAELGPLFDRTYDYLAETLGAPARRGEAVLRMTPVGYSVEAFTPKRASVAVWQVTLLATPDRSPIAAWATSRAELVWSAGRWRVERFGVDTPGPTPGVTAPATPTRPAKFVAVAGGFTPFAP